MKQEHYTFISHLFPFRGIKEKNIELIFSGINYSLQDFSKGEIIFSPSCYQKKIGFIISGEAEVALPRDEHGSVPLNTLSKYASFGIMAIFSKSAEYPTEIRATKSSTVLFIDGADMLKIIKKYPTISMNVIMFLTDRISFLNGKIATFSGKSTAKKLATYLLKNFKAGADVIITSRTKISAEINVGRASLYRDLDALEKSGLIKTEAKKIIIIDPDGLERISK